LHGFHDAVCRSVEEMHRSIDAKCLANEARLREKKDGNEGQRGTQGVRHGSSKGCGSRKAKA
jgi:hypothetical protein